MSIVLAWGLGLMHLGMAGFLCVAGDVTSDGRAFLFLLLLLGPGVMLVAGARESFRAGGKAGRGKILFGGLLSIGIMTIGLVRSFFGVWQTGWSTGMGVQVGLTGGALMMGAVLVLGSARVLRRERRVEAVGAEPWQS